jgi:oligosaccharyltransferase complex subunit beta
MKGDLVGATYIATTSAPVLFSGISHRISGKNILNSPVLAGSETSFTLDDGALTSKSNVGQTNVLVSAFQARNNARVIFAGSDSLFSDALFEASVSEG